MHVHTCITFTLKKRGGGARGQELGGYINIMFNFADVHQYACKEY